MVQVMRCPCGAKVHIEFDPGEVSRVVPCPSCFHDRWFTWIENPEGKVIASAVEIVDGKKVPVPHTFKNRKEEHGNKLRLFPDGRVEVAQAHACNCNAT